MNIMVQNLTTALFSTHKVYHAFQTTLNEE